ncbi:hypothetical protein ABZT34_26250 [Streptomyces sp. NPDC005329]|uniref:hypothetical protein n=1 Tax=Streptomyces sp. NPDC005329 TaxID=3157034 RepID=UPI0033A04BDE
MGEERFVKVSWLPSAWAAGYTVLRGIAPEGPFERLATEVPKPACTDTDVRAGRTYH